MERIDARYLLDEILRTWTPVDALEKEIYEAIGIAKDEMDYRFPHEPIVLETFDSFTGTTTKEYRCPGCKKPIAGKYKICPICGQFIKVKE